MTFFIFMAILALALIFALWLVFQPGKPRPKKKNQTGNEKNTPHRTQPCKTRSEPSEEGV